MFFLSLVKRVKKKPEFNFWSNIEHNFFQLDKKVAKKYHQFLQRIWNNRFIKFIF